VTNNDPTFKSKSMISFCERNGIILKNSTSYYPQGNGLAESTNKNIISSIKKMLSHKKKDWDKMLKYALWVDRVTTKKSIGTSPFQLVYGVDAIFPIRLSFLVINLMQDIKEEANEVNRRMLQIVQLQQEREALIEKDEVYKRKVKKKLITGLTKTLFW